jgi:hypothetical protein
MTISPVFLTRLNGAIVEVVSDCQTMRDEQNHLTGIEKELARLFGEGRDIRLLTPEEAIWLPENQLRRA